MSPRKLLSLLLILLFALPTSAVLRERDLARTLGVLRAELEQNYPEKKAYVARLEAQSRSQHKALVGYMQRSEQIALMLYSQKDDHTFDLSYACRQATDLYRLLNDNLLPFDQVQAQLTTETQRYAQLIRSLEELPPTLNRRQATQSAETVKEAVDSLSLTAAQTRRLKRDINALSEAYTLTPEQQRDRAVCLRLVRDLHASLARVQSSLKSDRVYYLAVKAKVESLNAYAMARYRNLQHNIFLNGGDNYLNILRNLPEVVSIARADLKQKYSALDHLPSTYSEWRGPVVVFMLLFVLAYVLLSIGLAAALLRFAPRWWLPHDFTDKRRTYFTALGLLFFALSIFVVRLFTDQGFTLMAMTLMTNIAWLALAIVASLLVRLNGAQIGKGLHLYLPFVLMAFIVVAFRVLFIPNVVINLIYPPLLLLFAFWQVRTLRLPKGSVPTSDILYASASMLAMCAATVMAWIGFVLMAVQLMVWWMFQLAALQTINALYHLLSRYEHSKVLPKLLQSLTPEEREGMDETSLLQWAKQGGYITRTWAYDFVNRTVIPILAVGSIFLSVWYAAGVFEMTDVVRMSFSYNFIDQPGLIQLSLHKISFVIAFWFVFSYLNYALRSFYQHVTRMRGKLPSYQYNFTLANNVIAILVWGAYILYALFLLQVPKSGIGVVTAGLATGMGFAMKDLLENFFYGISLMAGRVRVGDFIECDGIRGRVESISYQSTQISTFDGSVIAFLNTQLFNKNFKNLTRDNAYELAKIPLGVGYGSDVQQVRSLVIDALTPLNEILPDGRTLFKPDTSIGVSFSDFGASSVDLIVVCWVLVEQRAAFLSHAREIIYNTLNQHQVEIPFPQVDVHMR